MAESMYVPHPIHLIDGILVHAWLLIVAAGHGEQVAYGHVVQILAGIGRQLVGEETHHLVHEVQFSLADSQSDGRGGECLTDGMHHVWLVGRLSVEPSFEQHLAILHNHDTMQLNGIGWGRAALGCFNKGIHSCFHLCCGRTAWEVNHFFWGTT